MSKILVDTIDTRSGTTNLTIGSTNSSTVTFENGAVTGHMYPAFHIRKSSQQTISDETYTLITFDAEEVDTDSAFASNKFTVPSGKAGKYFIYTQMYMYGGSVDQLGECRLEIYKNGSGVPRARFQSNNSSRANQYSPYIGMTMDLSVGDYLEVYARGDVASGTINVYGESQNVTYFGGYRIGS